jgi:hypothetical protein
VFKHEKKSPLNNHFAVSPGRQQPESKSSASDVHLTLTIGRDLESRRIAAGCALPMAAEVASQVIDACEIAVFHNGIA